MKIHAIAATIASLASLTAAFDVAVTFHGARGERFGQTFPTDASSHAITNPMIVFRISSPGGGFCTFTGVKGETVTIYAEDEKELREPQAMKWGVCDTV